jgi:uncharacterized protein YgbK (DUF1537 family)
MRFDAEVIALDLDTRSRPERSARRVVRRAFSARAAKRARVLFKKIDPPARGHRRRSSPPRGSIGAALFTPAFPTHRGVVRDRKLSWTESALRRPARAARGRAARRNGSGTVAALSRAMRAAPDRRRAASPATPPPMRISIASRARPRAAPRPLFVGSAGPAARIARTFRASAGELPAVAHRPV